jgi:hypothetical protein
MPTSEQAEPELVQHGYHRRDFPKGEYGELSKLYEEINEVKDSQEQGVSLMLLHELSDCIGAIQGFLEKHHPSLTLDDLIKMSDRTRAAFLLGDRK